MKAFKMAALCICLTAVVLLFSGCAGVERDIEPQGKAYFTYFDTVSYVYSYAGDSAEQFNDRSAEVSTILGEYHRLFDIYHEYSGINNICTINRLAGGEPVEVDRRLIDFLLYAKELYYKTDGEMNVMMGAVLSIWHDYRTAALDDPSKAEIPPEEELLEAAEHTDISLLEIDEEKLTVRLSDAKASLDVGALGKGYAAERAADYLAQDDAAGYVLNIGGNIRTIGTKPGDEEWTTGVRDPEESSNAFSARLRISDTSCVTSGYYERFYTVNGVRYHHIIDKDTLSPADYFASVTVLTRDSALADALSTALFCMSHEDGAALAERIGGVEVLWILPDGETVYTPGMRDKIILG